MAYSLNKIFCLQLTNPEIGRNMKKRIQTRNFLWCGVEVYASLTPTSAPQRKHGTFDGFFEVGK